MAFSVGAMGFFLQLVIVYYLIILTIYFSVEKNSLTQIKMRGTSYFGGKSQTFDMDGSENNYVYGMIKSMGQYTVNILMLTIYISLVKNVQIGHNLANTYFF